jgi:2-keto-4-pentenoate hydratase/2-oxohepta-3-ene-1,7-dioic acid hydratase in catechol pathway
MGNRVTPPAFLDPAARIFAMGGNFPMHTTEMTKKMQLPPSLTDPDAPPWGFYVIPGTIVGHEDTVTPPAGTRFFDYEAEIAVVLGDDGKAAGYTGWSDFSIRDPAFKMSLTDHGPLTWSLQKNFATGNACGPRLVKTNDVSDVRIVCRVNGEERQNDTTAAMKFSVDDIVAHITEYLPLRAGDVIVCGTPGGTAMEYGPDSDRWLQDGDVVEVEVGEAGVLRNTVRFP